MKIYDGSSSICQLDDSNNKMNFAIVHTQCDLSQIDSDFLSLQKQIKTFPALVVQATLDGFNFGALNVLT